MKKILLILFLTPLLTLGQKVKSKKYDHPEYSIEYPVNWILDESGKEGSSFLVYPNTETDKDFVENINLIKQNLGQNELTIEQLKSIIENQVSNMLDNSKIILTEIINDKGISYHKLLVTGETSGMNFITRIHTIPIENNLFTLTLVSKAEDYENIKNVSNQIMNSFTIK